MKTTVPVGNHCKKLCITTEAISVLPVVHHTVRGTYGTPEAGTRTACVQCVGPRGKLPCASGTYSTQEAGTRSPHHSTEGPGRTCQHSVLPIPVGSETSVFSKRAA